MVARTEPEIMEEYLEELLKPDVLKKIHGLKDTFVYRQFFRLLMLITKSFICILSSLSQLISSNCSSTCKGYCSLSQEIFIVSVNITS